MLLNETILCFIISKGTETLYIAWVVQRNLRLFALKAFMPLTQKAKYGHVIKLSLYKHIYTSDLSKCFDVSILKKLLVSLLIALYYSKQKTCMGDTGLYFYFSMFSVYFEIFQILIFVRSNKDNTNRAHSYLISDVYVKFV